MKRSLPANEIEDTPEDLTAPILEISEPALLQHITTAFFDSNVVYSVQDSLPYEQLGGAGLERLCYSLILARGGVPRYFGNPGQKQYGIDLMVSNGADCTVYQCKNVNSFTRQNMGEALQLFEQKWLGHALLPKPTEFVLCCPLPLRERRLNEEWTVRERQFFDSTGVRVVVWDKDYLDSQLKKHPDVVADSFSDQLAERFCDLGDWNEDLFRPVRIGSGEPTVNRYLGKKASGQIYLDARLSEKFFRCLELYGSLLILGLPGSGKTTTALALAESFQRGLYRVFYISMRHDISEDVLVRGIRRRLARPTVFLIDDCHGKYEILEGVRDRLREVLARQSGKALPVYVARTTPTPVGMPRADYSGFVEEFKTAGATLEFQPTRELFANIAVLTNPELRELSDERLDRIFSTTGRDLLLLDELLEAIKSPDAIDRFKAEHLFEQTLVRYFGQPTVHRPGFLLLTALAQFEIAPTVADFPYNLRSEDPKAAEQLLVEADRPLRYFFLHTSAAELIFRALVWNDRIDNHAEATAQKLVEFFETRPPTDAQMPADVSSVLRNRLKLRDDEGEEYLLKGRFLANDEIFALVAAAFERLSLNTVALILNILKSTEAATFMRYCDLVQEKIDDGTALRSLISSLPLQFLKLTKDEYPLWYSSLTEQFADQGLSQLVRTMELPRLLHVLANLSRLRDFVSDSALDSVSDDELDQLIQRTITSRRFKFYWQLLRLKNTNLPLLERLELKIGTERFLRLIVSIGTVSELFSMMQFLPQSMIVELIEALNNEILDGLVRKTVSTDRSIGTIGLALRELKETNVALLERLESKFGAYRFLRLVVGTGTIFELFELIEHSSLSMAAELIEALDDETLDNLISKTIAAGRSIATVDLAMRELKETDVALLERLESKFGAHRFLRLVIGTGTIFELFRLIQHSSLSMAAELIEALDDQTLDSLINKTITAGRSIATLDWTLRELKVTDAHLLEQLELKIGAHRFLRLVIGTGTVFELFRLIQHSSLSMSAELIAVLDDETMKYLTERTITSGRSIGTLSFTLRQLKMSVPNQLHRLERKIGVDGWWKLILANGKMNVISPLMQSMDDSFKREMVRASRLLTTSDWDRLILRGNLGDLAVFVRIGEGYSPKLFTSALIKRLNPTFEGLIQAADWATLHLATYRLSESPDSLLKDYLESSLHKHFAGIGIGALRFDAFDEAAGCISLLYREVPLRRDEVAQALFEILPKADKWFRDASFLRAACGPLFALASSQSSPEIDTRMLDLCNQSSVVALFASAKSFDIFLYLWNLFTLWFKSERIVKRNRDTAFAKFVDPEIRTRVNRIVDKRLRSKTNELEKEHLVSLVGFLLASGLTDFSKEDKLAWLASLPSFDMFIPRVEGTKSFLTASFFLIGLGWIFDRRKDIPQSTLSNVMSKAISYEKRTDAFENLRRLFSAHFK